MAQYFSKLNENNFIIQTVVLGDNLPTSDGMPGIDNSDAPYRKRYGGVGMQYLADEDVFIYPKPINLFPSFILDENYEWIPPITEPTTRVFDDGGLTRNLRLEWDEVNQSWWANDSQTEPKQYDWDLNTLTWSKRV
mgnify:CR=1 FL=1